LKKHPKRPSAATWPQPAKRPRFGSEPEVGTVPSIAADPSTNHLPPSWRIGRLQLVHPFGWHELTGAKIRDIRDRLANFESMSWNDIVVKAKKRNHTVAVSKVCKEARDRLLALHIDIDEIVSLHLTGTERVWGYRDGAILNVLWWDPHHQICPSLLK
jgi:hypothetical protein